MPYSPLQPVTQDSVLVPHTADTSKSPVLRPSRLQVPGSGSNVAPEASPPGEAVRRVRRASKVEQMPLVLQPAVN